MHKIQTIKTVALAGAVFAVFALLGCGPKVETNGYVKREEIKSLITPGKSTRDEVQTTLGSPSAQSTFGNDSWYYITDRKEAYAFMKYDIVEQNVTRIDFDENGLVTSVDDYDKSNSEDIQLVKRETATEGHTLGFFEQMLGNIGRFNAPGGGGAANPAGGRRGPAGR